MTLRSLRAASAAPLIGSEIGIAALAATGPGAVPIVGAALTALVVLTVPWVILIGTLPAAYSVRRIGPGIIDMSVADLWLIFATVVSFAFVPWRHPALRRIMRLVAAYLAILLICVLVVPSERALAEWGHRLIMIVGGIFVGAAIVNLGKVTVALRVFVGIGTVMAFKAIQIAMRNGFSPAYPFAIHKNTAAPLMGYAVFALYLARDQVRLPRWLSGATMAVLIAGMAATQSRAGAVGLVAVFAVSAWRSGRLHVSPVMMLGGVGAAVMVWVTVKSNLHTEADQTGNFGSINSRVVVYEAVLRRWHDGFRSLIFGDGIRFYRDPATLRAIGGNEPHNVVVSTLGETGLVGLIALILLLAGLLVLLWRIRSPLTLLAMACVINRFVVANFDIYWLANLQDPVWVIVGMALASATVARTVPLTVEQRVGAPWPAPDQRLPDQRLSVPYVP